jgi:aminomethyltransferase
MDRTSPPKHTPLHAVHVESGARLVPFAGWEMPVQYAGVVEEHLAVRAAAGLFDVSHMGEVEVCGPGAAAALQRLTCNDIASLALGQAHYSALLLPDGGILDDVIVYRWREGSFLVVVNASNAAADLAWMREHAGSAQVIDRSDDFALIAIQGPKSTGILAPLTDADLGSLRYYRLLEAKVGGEPAFVARTGYTGEDGFEIFLPPSGAAGVWRRLLEVGAAVGIVPAGLGARDTLRLEAGMLLHGNDITATTSPLEAGLDFMVKLDREEFIGRGALIAQRREGVKRRMCGLEMIDPGIARHGYPVWIEGGAASEVTSGSHAPFLKKNIARAYLPIAHADVGAEVEVEVRQRRLRARVVPTPFYRRPRR